MASPPARFRPALLTVASLACLLGYVFLVRTVGESMPRYFDGSAVLALGFLLSAAAAPALYLARIVARTRLLGTGKDAFAGLRRWFTDRPRAAFAILNAPAILGHAFAFHPSFIENFRAHPHGPSLSWAIGYAVSLWFGPAIAMGLLGRALIGGMLAPLAEDKPPAPAEQFTFSAVAVTPEARAAVGAVFALTVAVVAIFSNLEQRLLYTPAGAAGLLAYIATAVGAALLFQRVSRIGLGFDGVLVTGSSRTRFFAYRDVDAVEATPWGDVVLLRHGRVVLRLQLHGADEGRHAAIAARVLEGIARACETRTGGAARLAEARGKASLAGAAQGLGSFRAPGVTRDELWELVEAPSTDAASRSAAAEALASGADDGDRTRMRIAAERCAEPQARAVLTRIAAGEEAEEEDDGSTADERLLRLRPRGP